MPSEKRFNAKKRIPSVLRNTKIVSWPTGLRTASVEYTRHTRNCNIYYTENYLSKKSSSLFWRCDWHKSNKYIYKELTKELMKIYSCKKGYPCSLHNSNSLSCFGNAAAHQRKNCWFYLCIYLHNMLSKKNLVKKTRHVRDGAERFLKGSNREAIVTFEHGRLAKAFCHNRFHSEI